MKLNEKALAHASAILIGIVYVFCGVSIALFPELAKTTTRAWFHGIDLEKIWSSEPFPGNFLMGLVSAVALTWVAMYLFAYLYNMFLRKK